MVTIVFYIEFQIRKLDTFFNRVFVLNEIMITLTVRVILKVENVDFINRFRPKFT